MVYTYTDIDDLRVQIKQKMPALFEAIRNLGLKEYERECIIIHPNDLSLGYRESNWYIKEANNDYQLVVPDIYKTLNCHFINLIKKRKSFAIIGEHGIGKSVIARLYQLT